MTGLDWDARREQAIARLREATAITGCTSTRHHDEPPIPDTEVSLLWNKHIAEDAPTRRRRDVQRIIVDVVTERLQAVELRHDLAPGLLIEVAANPAAVTAEERAAIAAGLLQISEEAAANGRPDGGRHQVHHCRPARPRRPGNPGRSGTKARRRTATTINAGDANHIDPAAAAARSTAIVAGERFSIAVNHSRRAGMKARRTDSTERRMTTLRRHPHVGDLLNPDDDAMSSGNAPQPRPRRS